MSTIRLIPRPRGAQLLRPDQDRFIFRKSEFYDEVSRRSGYPVIAIKSFAPFEKAFEFIADKYADNKKYDDYFESDKGKVKQVRSGLVDELLDHKPNLYERLIAEAIKITKDGIAIQKAKMEEEYRKEPKSLVKVEKDEPKEIIPYKEAVFNINLVPELIKTYEEYKKEQKKLKKVDPKEIERKRIKKLQLENKQKYKKMAKESNQLAREIQKTIERVAAQGFGGGEYQYTGRGLPKKSKVPKRKPKMKRAMGTRPHKGGKFEDPADEVAYILERLSDMVKEGDIQHISLVAKKLRKAKRIGKGKYIFMDDYEGGAVVDDYQPRDGLLEGGKRKKRVPKEDRPKREMTPKQKAWIKHIKRVRKENPELSYKDAMKLASSQRQV